MNAKEFTLKLIALSACSDAIEFAKNKTLSECWAICERPDWMLWLYGKSSKLNKKKCVQIAVYSAETCIDNFEKKYPDDKRPREAIEAAKIVIANDKKMTRSSADSAACSAACSAAYSAADSAAYSAADSAAYSADSAARSACSAAYSAARSACSAAYSAAYSAADKKICEYIRKIVSSKEIAI